MAIVQALNSINGTMLASEQENKSTRLTGSQSFTYALDAAKNLLDANKTAEVEANQKTIDFMTGENDNIVDLMVAQEKSSILLQYALQVRNGVLSSYKEIMNLSI